MISQSCSCRRSFHAGPSLSTSVLKSLGAEPIARCRGPARQARARAARRCSTRRSAEARAQLLESRTASPAPAPLATRMDELVRIIHDAVVRHLYPADNPSPASASPSSATGGYGRGTLAPGSDVDLLFLLPYKQTAWSESVVEAMLYVLWDLKLKVGHATRSVEECLREAQARHDDPHLAARSALPVRRPGALRQPGSSASTRRSSRPRRPNSSTPS